MRKFFAILLSLCFWVILPMTLLLLGIKYVTFDPNTYKNALKNENIYQRTIQLAPDLISKFLINGNDAVPIPRDSIANIAQTAVSETWLQGNVEKIIDNTFLLITTDADPKKLDTSISLLDIRNGINNNLPEQTELINLIPEKFDLWATLQQNKVTDYLYGIKAIWQTFNLIVIIFSIATAIILLLIILLLCNNLKNLLRWTGISLFVPGAYFLPFLLVPKFLLRSYLTSLFLTKFYLSIDLTTPLVGLIYNIVSKFINFLLLPNIIILAMGLVLIILSFIIKHKQNVNQ